MKIPELPDYYNSKNLKGACTLYIGKMVPEGFSPNIATLIFSACAAVRRIFFIIALLASSAVGALLLYGLISGTISLILFGIDSFTGKTLIEQIALAGFMAFLVFLATTAVFFCIEVFTEEEPGADVDCYSETQKEDMMKNAERFDREANYGYYFRIRDDEWNEIREFTQKKC